MCVCLFMCAGARSTFLAHGVHLTDGYSFMFSFYTLYVRGTSHNLPSYIPACPITPLFPHVPTSDTVCSSDITSTNADAAAGVDDFDVRGVGVWSEIEYRTGSGVYINYSEHNTVQLSALMIVCCVILVYAPYAVGSVAGAVG